MREAEEGVRLFCRDGDHLSVRDIVLLPSRGVAWLDALRRGTEKQSRHYRHDCISDLHID